VTSEHDSIEINLKISKGNAHVRRTISDLATKRSIAMAITQLEILKSELVNMFTPSFETEESEDIE